jgi:site-specific recombinase XerD
VNAPQVLSSNELERLLSAASSRRHVNATRDHALLALLVNTGCRPGEALALHVADLHINGERVHTIRERPWIRVRRLKRRTPYFDDVPVSRALALVLNHYTRGHRIHDHGALPRPFEPASRLFPLTVRTAERIFHYHARRAGLDSGLRLYALRHTAATRALEATGDIRAVQVMLGHARVTTTQVYAHVRPERRAALAELVGGLV